MGTAPLEQQSLQQELRLLSEGKIQTPELRTWLLLDVATTLLGNDAEVVKKLREPETPLDDAKFEAIIGDLQQIESLRVAGQAVDDTTNSIGTIPDDDALKDRISRVFLSSMSFKICFGVLAVGTALFGINLGVLSLDTSAITRATSDANKAISEAKHAGDDAKSQVQAAVYDATTKIPSLVVDKLDLKEIETRVIVELANRLQPKFDAIDNRVGAAEKAASAANDQLRALSPRIDGLQKTTDSALEKASQAKASLESWYSAIDVANKTPAHSWFNGFVWWVLRSNSILLLGSIICSAVALLLSGLSSNRVGKVVRRFGL